MIYYYIFMCSNRYEIEGMPITGVTISEPFTLEIQETIKQYQPKAVTHLNRLKDVLGVELQYIVDFQSLHKNLPSSIFKQNMGEIVLDYYLGALVNNIIDFITKYPEKRISFLIKASKKRILFNPLVTKTHGPIEVLFNDGILCINLEPSQFGFLPEKTGQDLSKLFV